MAEIRSSVALLAIPLGIFVLGCGSGELVERRDGTRFSLAEPVNERALRYYTEALDLLRAGKVVEAETRLEKAHQLAPRNGPVAALLARLLARRDPQQAKALLLRVLPEAEEKSPLHAELVELSLASKDFEQAIAHARLALLANPDSERARQLLRRALVEAGFVADSENVERVHRALTSEPPLEKIAASLEEEDRLFRDDSPTEHGRLIGLILEGDVAKVRDFTKGALTDGELALTCLRYGRGDLASDLASARLELDKNDPCALLAAAVAADYLRKEPLAVSSAMAKCGAGKEFFEDLVLRRIGASIRFSTATPSASR